MDDDFDEAEYSLKAATLSAAEIEWRDRQPHLERHGYMLRPRYQPNWIPSWQQRSTYVHDSDEDALSSFVSGFL